MPQKIYLIDDTITNNIVLSSNLEPNKNEKFKKVLELSKLTDLFSGKKETGERGAKLSGGQIQKIGIGRALYKESDLLIFDEGTVALDDKNEEDIISNILSLDYKPTIVFITHKRNLLKHFDLVYELKDGEIKQINITS